MNETKKELERTISNAQLALDKALKECNQILDESYPNVNNLSYAQLYSCKSCGEGELIIRTEWEMANDHTIYHKAMCSVCKVWHKVYFRWIGVADE